MNPLGVPLAFGVTRVDPLGSFSWGVAVLASSVGSVMGGTGFVVAGIASSISFGSIIDSVAVDGCDRSFVRWLVLWARAVGRFVVRGFLARAVVDGLRLCGSCCFVVRGFWLVRRSMARACGSCC